MDFDSILTILFLFFFFVLPSVLKQVKRAKKKMPNAPAPGRSKEKGTVSRNSETSKKAGKSSLFHKINEQIQTFVKELERQAREQKQARENKQPGQAGEWDRFKEDPQEAEDKIIWDDGTKIRELPGGGTVLHDTFERSELKSRTRDFHIPEERTQVRKYADKKASAASMPRPARPAQRPVREFQKTERLRFNPDPLKNAVIWAEILNKPVGLRK